MFPFTTSLKSSSSSIVASSIMNACSSAGTFYFSSFLMRFGTGVLGSAAILGIGDRLHWRRLSDNSSGVSNEKSDESRAKPRNLNFMLDAQNLIHKWLFANAFS